MNKKNENILLAFTEWLDKEVDGYVIFATRDGNSTLVANGDEEELIKSIAMGLARHAAVREIVFNAIERLPDILEKIRSKLN